MNEVVVVVGASGAFGSAIVQRLIGRDLDVVAVGRRIAGLERLVELHGTALRPCVADISNDESIHLIRHAVGTASVVRAVVHGPGVAVAGGVDTVPTQALVDAVNVKVGGLLRLVRATKHALAKDSRVIAIAGHYGLEPSQYAAAAGVANAALFNAVRQLSLAYGGRGVTAHTIAPGPADTERLHRVAADRATLLGTTEEAVLQDMLSESSIGRFTTPGQVAWAVDTLLSPEASSMTGSTLMLDSGRRKGLP